MKLYAYSQSTGEFLQAMDAMASPLEPGKYLHMENSTTVAPPAPESGYAPIWTGEVWEQQEDHRGQTLYKTSDGSPITVERLGPLSEAAPDTTAKAPPDIPSGKRRIWTGKKWAFEDLPPPEVVSMRQARLALLNAGMLDAVNTAIAEMPGTDGEAARIEWEFAQSVRRDNPLLIVIVTQMGMTDKALDALFIAASRL